MTQEIQNQIDELEMKAAFQEQTISDLNEELIKHGQRIAELEQQVTRMIEMLQTDPAESASEDERPPHY